MFTAIIVQNLQDTNQYVHSEMDALEREQNQIDEQAANVEGRLRIVMAKGTCDKLLH